MQNLHERIVSDRRFSKNGMYPTDGGGPSRTAIRLATEYARLGLECLQSGRPLEYSCETLLRDAYRTFPQVLTPFELSDLDPAPLVVSLRDHDAGLVPGNFIISVSEA